MAAMFFARRAYHHDEQVNCHSNCVAPEIMIGRFIRYFNISTAHEDTCTPWHRCYRVVQSAERVRPYIEEPYNDYHTAYHKGGTEGEATPCYYQPA